MNDYEGPAVNYFSPAGRSWKKYSKKEKLIVDSHNVNIVVKR